MGQGASDLGLSSGRRRVSKACQRCSIHRRPADSSSGAGNGATRPARGTARSAAAPPGLLLPDEGNTWRVPPRWQTGLEPRGHRSYRAVFDSSTLFLKRRCPLTAGDPVLTRETAGSTPPSATSSASVSRQGHPTFNRETRVQVPVRRPRPRSLEDGQAYEARLQRFESSRGYFTLPVALVGRAGIATRGQPGGTESRQRPPAAGPTGSTPRDASRPRRDRRGARARPRCA